MQNGEYAPGLATTTVLPMPHARVPARPLTRARTLTFLVVTIVTFAGFFDAVRIACRLVQTSDTVVSFLAANDVIHGNPLLQGWRMVVDNFFFTDVIPFAVAEGLWGCKPFLLALVPAATYAIFVFAAQLCCVTNARPAIRNLDAIAVVALLLATPRWVGNWNPMLFSDMHLGSALGALVALLVCARISAAETRAAKITGLAGLFVVTILTVASDPYSLVFGFAPAALVLCTGAARERSRAPSCAAIVLGAAIGLVLPLAVAHAGGFRTLNNVRTAFVSAPHLGWNLISILFGSLHFFAAYPFGLQFASRPALLALVCTGAFALVAVALFQVIRKLFPGEALPLLDRLLGASVLCVLLACALSAQYSAEVTASAMWEGGGADRYLIPAVLLSSVLAARRAPEILQKLRQPRLRRAVRTAIFAGTAVVLFLGSGPSGLVEAQPAWIFANREMQVARWLSAHALTQGVGEYWSANIVSAMSGGRVKIRTVELRAQHLVPFPWAQDARGYSQKPQFVIWQVPNLHDVTLTSVRSTWPGAICNVAALGDYRVAVLANSSVGGMQCGGNGRK